MKQGTFLRQIRAYGALALAKRVSFADPVVVMAVSRWETVKSDTPDPEAREAARQAIVRQVLDNYSVNDPFRNPDADVIESALTNTD